MHPRPTVLEAIGTAMASPQGHAAAAELANFAGARADIFPGNTRLV